MFDLIEANERELLVMNYKIYQIEILFDLISTMDLMNHFEDHRLLIMNQEYSEIYMLDKFDNSIYKSNSKFKRKTNLNLSQSHKSYTNIKCIFIEID